MATALQEFLATLKQKLNLVDVVKSYVTLDRRGNNWWACCPFHHEKTPSFAVNEAEQYYHCFGCGESGDMFKFIRGMENVEFMDAVKILADRAGLDMPQSGFDNSQTTFLKQKRDTYLKIMNDCAHFYLDNLNSGKADAHIDYILSRKISSGIVRTFGLGASLNYVDLPRYLMQKGYDIKDCVECGAVNYTDGKYTDAQGGRLIYPIINAMGEVIAFGGRVLRKTEFSKYKNTKDTLIFNKSKNLYNVNLLKKLRKTQTIKEVIMVEGYMDVISLYQAGFKNVVASMGTSFTKDQARLLKRYADNVLISYDGDSAGQKANMRGLDILKDEGLNVKVVPLPEGLDPDDVIKNFGADGYQKCLNDAMPLIDYKIAYLERGFDLNKTEDRRNFVSGALKIIATASSAAEREDLLKQLRDKTGITYESLSRDLNQTGSPPPHNTETPKKRDISSLEVKSSRFVIAAYLFSARYAEGDISEIRFASQTHEIIAKYIRSKKLLEEKIQVGELFEFFEDSSEEYEELKRVLDLSESLDGEIAEKYFNDCLKNLKLYYLNEKISSLTAAADNESDAESRKRIATELQSVIQQREKLKSEI